MIDLASHAMASALRMIPAIADALHGAFAPATDMRLSYASRSRSNNRRHSAMSQSITAFPCALSCSSLVMHARLAALAAHVGHLARPQYRRGVRHDLLRDPADGPGPLDFRRKSVSRKALVAESLEFREEMVVEVCQRVRDSHHASLPSSSTRAVRRCSHGRTCTSMQELSARYPRISLSSFFRLSGSRWVSLSW